MYYICNMKKIIEFFFHIFYGIYNITSNFEAARPFAKSNDYEVTYAITWFIGLIGLYIFDFLCFLCIALYYILGKETVLHLLQYEWIYYIAAIVFLLLQFVVCSFFLRKQKYKCYFYIFDKESKENHTLWSFISVLLFVAGIIIIYLLAKYKQLYIPVLV